MAKKQYIGVSGIARNTKKQYVGVSGVARKVKKGYVGVSGVARQFFNSEITLSSLAVGSSVWMNVNGTATEFLVVHQGLPSSMYDESCNGTWLVMKNIYSTMVWTGSGGNVYSTSSAHTYLNGTFLGLFDSAVQNLIKNVKIPYINGYGYSGNMASSSSGLSAKIFYLSAAEVGFTTADYQYTPSDGSVLSYFSSASMRIALHASNGRAGEWWTRSPGTGHSEASLYVTTSGGIAIASCDDYAYGVRPAFVLPSTAIVDSNNTLIAA